ncbi:hypothetical protein CB17B0026 [Clostridium botulinum B str. Eklund 17B (NRP)]|nr:hypothetical protein CB17B0026 [Clostridium botulinum B str. Eklund 17B (NRP)]
MIYKSKEDKKKMIQILMKAGAIIKKESKPYKLKGSKEERVYLDIE